VTLRLTEREHAALQELVALQRELSGRIAEERRGQGGSFPDVRWGVGAVLRSALRDFARAWEAQAEAEGHADLAERYHRVPEAFGHE
jgi:hypothetical protein